MFIRSTTENQILRCLIQIPWSQYSIYRVGCKGETTYHVSVAGKMYLARERVELERLVVIVRFHLHDSADKFPSTTKKTAFSWHTLRFYELILAFRLRIRNYLGLIKTTIDILKSPSVDTSLNLSRQISLASVNSVQMLTFVNKMEALEFIAKGTKQIKNSKKYLPIFFWKPCF